jgi:hypothetical protein
LSTIIKNYWIYTTVLIENESGGKATGFLMAEKTKTKVYLVTNKHVIGKDENKRRNSKWLFLHINIESDDGSILGKRVEFCFELMVWKEHPNKDTDVIAFDITQLTSQIEKLKAYATLDEYLVTPELIQTYDIKIADEVMIIGYPQIHGLKHKITNFPVVREGIIATNIDEDLEDHYPSKDDPTKRTRVLRGFLVDGAVIPGSSGSPVILKPTPSRSIRNYIKFDSFPPMLLGIVAETRYAFTPDNMYSTNLGLVFNAETIRETISLINDIHQLLVQYYNPFCLGKVLLHLLLSVFYFEIPSMAYILLRFYHQRFHLMTFVFLRSRFVLSFLPVLGWELH